MLGRSDIQSRTVIVLKGADVSRVVFDVYYNRDTELVTQKIYKKLTNFFLVTVVMLGRSDIQSRTVIFLNGAHVSRVVFDVYYNRAQGHGIRTWKFERN